MKLKLASAYECPFAQRTWMAMLEKRLDFDMRVVDLRSPSDGQYDASKKPAWFLEMNPLGKVPALEIEGKCIYESLVCNEYLEDAFKQPSLAPEDALRKAEMRLIIARFESRIVPKFYKMLLTPSEKDRCKEEILDELLWLESILQDDKPYFMGELFSLADLALLPFFARFCVLEHYRGFSIPNDGKFSKVLKWYDTAKQRASFQETCKQVEEHYHMSWSECVIEVYARYANGSAQSSSAKDFK